MIAGTLLYRTPITGLFSWLNWLCTLICFAVAWFGVVGRPCAVLFLIDCFTRSQAHNPLISGRKFIWVKRRTTVRIQFFFQSAQFILILSKRCMFTWVLWCCSVYIAIPKYFEQGRFQFYVLLKYYCSVRISKFLSFVLTFIRVFCLECSYRQGS